MARAADVAGFMVGVAGAAASLAALRRTSPRGTAVASAAGLVVAAGVYPAARRSPGAAAARERVALGAYTGASALAASRAPRAATTALAALWASHAAFDATHHLDASSRLPDWYRPLCAGYDLVVAAGLLAAARGA